MVVPSCFPYTFPLSAELAGWLEDVSKNSSNCAAVWFRNDLRTIDHVPLADASLSVNGQENSFVVGVFIYHPHDFDSHDWGPPKLDFLHRNIRSLSETLWNIYSIPLFVIKIDDPNLSYSHVSKYAGCDNSKDNAKRLKLDVSLSPISERLAKLSDAFYSFCKALNISAIYGHAEIGPDEVARDAIIKKRFMDRNNEHQIVCHLDYPDQSLLPLGSVCSKSKGEPYKVFTPFRALWATTLLSLAKAAETSLNTASGHSRQNALPWSKLHSPIIPNSPLNKAVKLLKDESFRSLEFLHKLPTDSKLLAEWPEGEEKCIQKISSWITQNINEYKARRNIPSDENGTSKISPYLTLGVISICTLTRLLFEITGEGAIAPLTHLAFKHDIVKHSGTTVYLSELCWREFYRNILFSFPKVGKGLPFQSATQNIQWRDPTYDKEALADWNAWCAGKTGFPIVDAAMRQLLSIGWMHNRCRMIVASFLVKDLLIDWRKGEEFFTRHLIDADLASNNGGWQWAASTGTDSQPYFRIFHPISQGEKWDPEGHYIRKWVSELSKLPAHKIHNPIAVMDEQAFAKLR